MEEENEYEEFAQRTQEMIDEAKKAQERADAAEARSKEAQERADKATAEATEMRGVLSQIQEEVKHLRSAVVERGRGGLPVGGEEAPVPFTRALRNLFFDEEGKPRHGERSIQGSGLRLQIQERTSILDIARRGITVGASDSAGALTMPLYESDLAVTERRRKPVLLDFIPQISVNRDTIKYMRRTKLVALYAKTAAAYNAGVTSIVFKTDEGFKGTAGIKAGVKITLSPGQASKEVVTVTAVDHDTNTCTVTALTQNHAIGAEIYCEEFGFTPEGKYIPNANMKWDQPTATIKDIGFTVYVTEQSLRDADMLESELRMTLPEEIRRQVELQLLYGNGGDRELDGLLADTDVLTYSWSDGAVGDNKADAVRRAITQAMLANRELDLIVANPLDCQDFELLKSGDDGHYLRVITYGAMGEMILHRLPVVETSVIQQGDFLVGSFAQTRIYERSSGITVEFFREDRDNVHTDTVTVRVKAALAFANKEPEAFVHGDFDSAPV